MRKQTASGTIQVLSIKIAKGISATTTESLHVTKAEEEKYQRAVIGRLAKIPMLKVNGFTPHARRKTETGIKLHLSTKAAIKT